MPFTRVVVHLTASTFFGGPERQMLGLARHLPVGYRTVFLSFAEGSRCAAFLDEARRHGFEARALRYDTPHLGRAVAELAGELTTLGAAVLCCHGYKATLLGRVAARRRQVPVISVSRGWTAETWKVRLYEALEKLSLRWMDRVVCVSGGQRRKVLRAGVPAERTRVIRNAIEAGRFAEPDPEYGRRCRDFFAQPPRLLVGAAGRLSPEKGFTVLVEAAARVHRSDPGVGFLLFGDGAEREALARQIHAAGLDETFILAGFRPDLDRYLSFLDVVALPSFTEGLPNVLLEAFAASVPVVATAVGGVPEVVEDGVSGYLVPPGDPGALAGRLLDVLACEDRRREMGRYGRERVDRDFTFSAQGGEYQRLFEELTAPLRRSA
jgi:glycosyltransferase involved in cell wall biosynthesis